MTENKYPPFDLDAEQATLGAVLVDGDVMNELSFLKPADFFSEQNQILYKAFEELFNRGEAITQITVANELVGVKKLNDVGGTAYLSGLVAQVFSPIYAKHYGQIVKNTAIRRRLISASERISSIAYNENDPYKCLAQADEYMIDIQNDLSIPHVITPYQLAEKGVIRYQKLQNPQHRIAVSTGFFELDQFTGGLFPGEYTIMAARPSIGKSQIALQVAQNVGKIGPVLVFALEMNWQSVVDRLVAQKLPKPKYPQQVTPLQKIRRGGYSEEFLDNIMNISLPYISESNIYLMSLQNEFVEAPQFTLNVISSMARHVKMAYGLKLLVIDYIGLIDSPSSEQRKSRAEQVSAISKGIKHLCSSLEIPVLALAQINREPEKKEVKRPRLEHLKDSGSLEADADNVWLLYRDITGESDSNDAEMILAKQRQGQAGIILPMPWDSERGRYSCFSE